MVVKQVFCAYKARALHNARSRVPRSMYLAPLMVGLLLQGALKFCRTLPVAIYPSAKHPMRTGLQLYAIGRQQQGGRHGITEVKVRLGDLGGYLLR